MQPKTDPFHYAFPHTKLKRSLRILIATNTALTFVLGLFAPFYAIYVQKLGGGVAFAGFSWAVFAVVTGLLIITFSRLGVRVKEPELLIALGYFIRSFGFLSYAFMGSLSQLILTQVIWGIGTALSTPSYDSVYAAHTDGEQSMAQWGSTEGLAAIAAGVAAMVGGSIIQIFGYQTVFLIMAGVLMFLAIYIWQLPRRVL